MIIFSKYLDHYGSITWFSFDCIWLSGSSTVLQGSHFEPALCMFLKWLNHWPELDPQWIGPCQVLIPAAPSLLAKGCDLSWSFLTHHPFTLGFKWYWELLTFSLGESDPKPSRHTPVSVLAKHGYWEFILILTLSRTFPINSFVCIGIVLLSGFLYEQRVCTPSRLAMLWSKLAQGNWNRRELCPGKGELKGLCGNTTLNFSTGNTIMPVNVTLRVSHLVVYAWCAVIIWAPLQYLCSSSNFFSSLFSGPAALPLVNLFSISSFLSKSSHSSAS